MKKSLSLALSHHSAVLGEIKRRILAMLAAAGL
jgi:hypothetical protein